MSIRWAIIVKVTFTVIKIEKTLDKICFGDKHLA